FDDRWINDDAFRLVDKVLWNVIGNVHNFFKDDAAIVETICLLLIVLTCGGKRAGNNNERGQKCCEFLHEALLRKIDSRIHGSWLGALEPSNPASAGERSDASACLEEEFLNVWNILVLWRICQREADKTVMSNRLGRAALLACGFLCLASLARAQSHDKRVL